MNIHASETHVPRGRQQGVSLVVVLILLLVATLLGLVSLRGTVFEERMSASLYDRNLAFQAAERALREGEEMINSGVPTIGQDCTNPTVVCPMPNPVTGDIAGCVWADAEASAVSDLAGLPQYCIQRMRQSTTNQQLGQQNSAASVNAGKPAGAVAQANYRVFARSHAPGTMPGRSMVILQGNVVSQ